jgi:hypothetical protein
MQPGEKKGLLAASKETSSGEGYAPRIALPSSLPCACGNLHLCAQDALFIEYLCDYREADAEWIGPTASQRYRSVRLQAVRYPIPDGSCISGAVFGFGLGPDEALPLRD